MNFIHKITYLLSLLLCLFTQQSYAAVTQLEDGVLDLSNWDTSADPVIPLKGDWHFYWNTFLDSKTLDDARAIKRTVNVPSLWHSKDNFLVTKNGFATYHVKILAARKLNGQALNIFGINSSYELELDGAIIAKNGIISETPTPITATYPTMLVPAISVTKNEVDLILRISDHNTRGGGILGSIKLGDYTHLKYAADQQLRVDWFLCGSILLMAIYHLILFLIIPSDKATLWFCLFCLIGSARTLLTGDRFLYALFPSELASIPLRAEYLTVSLCLPLFLQFIRSLFPNQVNKKFAYLILGVSFVASVLIAFSPPVVFTNLFFYYQIVLAFTIASILYFVSRAIIEKEPESKIFLTGYAVLFLFIFNDLLYYYLFLETGFLFPVGLVLFLVSQLVILSLRFSRAQKEKVYTELRSEAKNEFFAKMSHELRTPLNAIIGFSGPRINNKASNERLQENLQTINRSGKHLLAIIDDVLDLSKLEAGKIQIEIIEVNLHELLQEVQDLLQDSAHDKGLEFKIKLPPLAHKYIRTDPLRLKQILINICGNAIKFTSEGGVALDVQFNEKSQQYIFNVIDTGIGIKSSQIEKLFNAFEQADISTTRNYGGSGLGLSIAQQLVLKLGGSILVESELGEGTTISIRLNKHSSETLHTSLQEDVVEAIDAPIHTA